LKENIVYERNATFEFFQLAICGGIANQFAIDNRYENANE